MANPNPCCNTKKHVQRGDKVYIIRHEHGWLDGRLTGIIKEIYHKETGGIAYEVEGEDGFFYYCPKRNDVRKV